MEESNQTGEFSVEYGGAERAVRFRTLVQQATTIPSQPSHKCFGIAGLVRPLGSSTMTTRMATENPKTAHSTTKTRDTLRVDYTATRPPIDRTP